MDKTILVEKDIENGKKLMLALDESHLPIEGGFWFYFTSEEEWRLMIVSSLVDEKGPKEAYSKIQQILEKVKLTSEIPLNKISVISPKKELIQLLRIAIRTGPEIGGIRFSQNTINGVYIEDAFIYRIQ